MREQLENILRLYSSSDRSTIDSGMHWYDRAHAQAKRLKEAYFLRSVRHACGVISVLSPAVQWEVNLKDAETVCATKFGDGFSVSTYGTFKIKAESIRDGDDPVKWINPKTAPKTWAFYHCLWKPHNTDHVVVDRHAIAACLGRRLTDKERSSMLRKVGAYSHYSQIYREAANQVGILPLQMQAICWTKWRQDHA